jgi:HEAT repeats
MCAGAKRLILFVAGVEQASFVRGKAAMERVLKLNTFAVKLQYEILALVTALLFGVAGLSLHSLVTPPSEAGLAGQQIQSWVSQLAEVRLTPARHAAQQHLEEAGPAAVDPLIAALSSGNPVLRRNAADMLGYIPSPLTVQALIGALERDPDATVRANAAWSLGEMNDARAVGPLERAAASDSSAQVREAARISARILSSDQARARQQ